MAMAESSNAKSMQSCRYWLALVALHFLTIKCEFYPLTFLILQNWVLGNPQAVSPFQTSSFLFISALQVELLLLVRILQLLELTSPLSTKGVVVLGSEQAKQTWAAG